MITSGLIITCTVDGRQIADFVAELRKLYPPPYWPSNDFKVKHGRGGRRKRRARRGR